LGLRTCEIRNINVIVPCETPIAPIVLFARSLRKSLR